MDIEEFSTEMRGYKKDQVDRVIEELRAELEHVREYNFNASNELDQLRSEVTALRKKKDNAPGYAELGAQFEQTLRLAEEQAKKLVSDAGQDAIRIRDTAKAESEQLLRKAQQRAEVVLGEADAKLNEAKVEAERLIAEKVQATKAKEVEAAEKVGTAQREAAAIKSEGERYAAELRASVHRETEEARAIATELAQRTAQARVELEAELKTKRDDSEQEALHMYQNAVAQAQQITDEANANFAASAELAGPQSYLVDGQPFWDATQDAWFNTPSIPAIVEALEKAYEARGQNTKTMVDWVQDYASERVYNTFWRPIINKLLA